MPINQTIFVKGSVGFGGKNQSDDVLAVQKQLNAHMNPPRKWLTEDGKSGKKTEGCIRDFQRNVLGFRHPDGRVDPNGKTLGALNDPDSEGVWGRMSMMPPEPVANGGPVDNRPGDGATGSFPGAPAGLSETDKAAYDRIVRSIKNDPAIKSNRASMGFAQTFITELCKTELQTIKLFLGAVGLLDTAQAAGRLPQVINGLRILKEIPGSGSYGRFAKDIAQLCMKHGTPQMGRLAAQIGKSAKIAAACKRVGKFLIVLGVLVAAIEIENHLAHRRYGPAAKEVYKAVGSFAAVWIAVIDALQSLMQGLAPQFCESPAGAVFFDILRACNILEHGGNAVDSLATMIDVMIRKYETGKVDWKTLDDLCDRLDKSSPQLIKDASKKFEEFLDDHPDAVLALAEWMGI